MDEARGAVWTWAISVIAAILTVWALVEFVRVDDDRGSTLARTAAAEPNLQLADAEAVALHRLLPDATGSVGTVVRVDGIVVGSVVDAGFWLRDLRDNVVYIATRDPSARGAPLAAGHEVRVLGTVALLLPGEQAEKLGTAGLVLPQSALVVRDVKVVPFDDGVDVLRP